MLRNPRAFSLKRYMDRTRGAVGECRQEPGPQQRPSDENEDTLAEHWRRLIRSEVVVQLAPKCTEASGVGDAKTVAKFNQVVLIFALPAAQTVLAAKGATEPAQGARPIPGQCDPRSPPQG